ILLPNVDHTAEQGQPRLQGRRQAAIEDRRVRRVCSRYQHIDLQRGDSDTPPHPPQGAAQNGRQRLQRIDELIPVDGVVFLSLFHSCVRLCLLFLLLLLLPFFRLLIFQRPALHGRVEGEPGRSVPDGGGGAPPVPADPETDGEKQQQEDQRQERQGNPQ